MRRKPSIFSREYEKRMRRRKIGIISLIVVVLIILVFIMSGDYVKPFIKDKIDIISSKIHKSDLKSDETTDDTVKNEEIPDQEENEDATNEIQEEQKETEQFYDVAIPEGVTVRTAYDEKEGVKSFKFVDPGENKISFDISKSLQQILILDEANQKMVLQDINGTTKDITLETYVSSSGTKFLRKNVLGRTPGYVWVKNPKFIDDTHIVYISQLPWFNKGERYYVWIVDTNNNSHKHINGLEGSSITIGDIADNGINLDIDGNKFILNSNGNVTKVN